jgi:hypothetical protein
MLLQLSPSGREPFFLPTKEGESKMFIILQIGRSRTWGPYHHHVVGPFTAKKDAEKYLEDNGYKPVDRDWGGGRYGKGSHKGWKMCGPSTFQHDSVSVPVWEAEIYEVTPLKEESLY